MKRAVLAVLLSAIVMPSGAIAAGPAALRDLSPAWRQTPIELIAAKKKQTKKPKPKAGKGHLGHH